MFLFKGYFDILFFTCTLRPSTCFLLMFFGLYYDFSLFVVHILTLRTLSSPQTITPHPPTWRCYLLTYLSRCPIDAI